MDDATLGRLYNEDHARCLVWFEERAGTTTKMPKPIGDGLFLATQFKAYTNRHGCLTFSAYARRRMARTPIAPSRATMTVAGLSGIHGR
jgi:hypothetical protein